MSERKTAETDWLQHCMPVSSVWEKHARRLERQRDAAVEALHTIRKTSWPVGMCVDEYARAVLAEIEGKS